MKSVRMLVALACVLLFASCSLKPTWDIIGKWEKVEGNEIVQFYHNGIVSLDTENTSLAATFKFSDPKHLMVYVGGFGTLAMEVSVTEKELILTSADGVATKYKRVK